MLPLKHYGIILGLLLTALRADLVLAESLVTKVFDKSKEAIQDYRASLHQWDALIRGYRRGHNYSLYGCSTSTNWESSIFEADLNTSEGCVGLSYGYHVKVYRIFGYMLGTSAEYNILREDDDDPITSDPLIYQLPGVTGGLLFYFSTGFRLMLNATYTLERIERLSVNMMDYQERYNITLQVFEYGVITDFFVSMHTGIRLFYKRKIRSNSSTFNMLGNSNSMGVGLVYHVL